MRHWNSLTIHCSLLSEGKLGRESLREDGESPIRGGFTELAKNEIDNLK